MAREFATGVRFAQVAALPAAASNAGIVLEQGGKLWFSDGAAWVDLGAAGGGGGSGVGFDYVQDTEPVSGVVDGETWLDTSTFGPADRWGWSSFGNTNAAASDLYAGAAISSGTNTTAIPAAALIAQAFDGIFLRSSTTANGGYRYQTTSLVGQIFGGISRKFRCQFQWLTSFTGRMVRLGFHDSNTSADAADGAYFEIDGATCRAKTANNSTRTTNATTVTLSLGVFYTFDIDVNAAGTEARFRVYSGNNPVPILDVTNTTNIPTTTSRSFGAGIVATESSTTASDIGILYGMGHGTVAAFNRAMGR